MLAGVLLATEASAQDEGFAIDRRQPSMVGDAFFSVTSATVGGHLVPRARLELDYAHEPLVLEQRCGDAPCPDGDRRTVVEHSLLAHVGAGLALWDRLALSVSMPVALVNSGEDGTTTLQAPDGAGAGDLRLGARGRLFGEAYDPFQVAINAFVWFPTGEREAFLGNGTVRGLPQLAFSGHIETGSAVNFIYSTTAGVLVREEAQTQDVALGTELSFGAAAGLLMVDDTLQIGPELYGSTVMVGDDRFASNTTHLELLGGVRYRFLDDFVVGLAGAPGLTQGVGTPNGRGLFSFAYSPAAPRADTDGDGIVDRDDACVETPGVPHPDPSKHGCPPKPDRDGDGIFDSVDACPDEPGLPNADPTKNGCPPPNDADGDGIIDEHDACVQIPGVRNPDPKKNGCPPDNDGDGIIDDEDACPTVPGVESDDPKRHGCPPDRDDDGIVDEQDACPDVPGVASKDPEKHGCPSDRDGDGIVDLEDACPAESGKPHEDPEKHGCPTLVRVTEKEIKILQQPRFAFAKAEIQPESRELLTQVKQVLEEHPEITLIRIEGHTDDKGPEAYNRRLSDRRANAVRDWLVKEGIDSSRLEATGRGEDEPLVANDTDANRAKNRRVEFHILRRKEPEKP